MAEVTLQRIEMLKKKMNQEIKTLLMEQLEEQIEGFLSSDDEFFLPYAHFMMNAEIKRAISELPSCINTYHDLLFSEELIEYAKRIEEKKKLTN